MASSLNENMKLLFSKMEDFVSTKTVVGEPVYVGDVILVPLVDVSFGMGTGGSGAVEKDAGGGAVGAKMTPAAMVVITNGTAQLINVKSQDHVNKLIDMVPGILAKFNLGSLFNKNETDENEEQDIAGTIVSESRGQ